METIMKTRSAAFPRVAALAASLVLGLILDAGFAAAHSGIRPIRGASGQLSPGASGQLSPGASGQASPAQATTRNAARLRTQLMALHGFSRAGLEAASTDVAAILRGFISDSGESMLIRRQAIKALRIYPSDETFTLIRNNITGAPEGLQRLYLHSLAVYAGARDTQIGALVTPLLSSDSVGVRHAAAGLSRRLRLSGTFRASLQLRLAEEPDAGVRSAIEKALRR